MVLRLLCLSSFLISGIALSQGGNLRPLSALQVERPQLALAHSLTLAQRLAKARLLFKSLASFIGVTSSLHLSVNLPMVANKGRLAFIGYRDVVADEFIDGYAISLLPGQVLPPVGPVVSLDIDVAIPNKPHLITFNLSAGEAQTLTFESAGLPTQTVQVPHGPVQAMVVYKPTSVGSLRIHMKGPKFIQFASVDIDVVK